MYDERPAAIRKRLDEAAAKSREVFKRAHDEALEKRVRDRLERYFDEREKALDEGVRLLGSPLPPKDHQDRWQRHFSDAGGRAAKELSDLVKDAKIETPFVRAVSSIAGRESSFFGAVAGMPLPSAQGRVLQWYGQFVREEKALRTEWKELSDQGSDLSKEMVEVMKEVTKLFDEAVKKAAAKARDAEEVLRRWLPVFQEAEDASGASEPGAVGTALEAIGYILDVLAALRPSLETLEGRFRSLYKNQETVGIILFGDKRSQVETFLDGVNLDKAVADFEGAAKECVEIAQGLKPPGQRDDAEDLVDKMIDEAHPTLEDFEDFFEEFVDEFRQIFIGPVGDRTVDDLVNRKLSIRESENYQRLNIQTELRKIQVEAEDFFDLPIGQLSEEKRRALEKLLENDLERLALAVREASDRSASERLRFIMELSWKNAADRVKRLPGASEG